MVARARACRCECVLRGGGEEEGGGLGLRVVVTGSACCVLGSPLTSLFLRLLDVVERLEAAGPKPEGGSRPVAQRARTAFECRLCQSQEEASLGLRCFPPATLNRIVRVLVLETSFLFSACVRVLVHPLQGSGVRLCMCLYSRLATSV